MAVVSNGFLPAWVLANEAWPGVCQSCVTTMFSNEPASLLITGTTCAPPFTGSVPPLTKQFCTSTTIRADLVSGLIVAANDGLAMAIAAVDARIALRDRPDAVRGMERSKVGAAV